MPTTNPTSQDNEFFIGYEPPMPSALARFVRRVVIGLGTGALGAAIVLASGHVRLQGGVFEFGQTRQMTGTLVEHPYPAIIPDHSRSGDSMWTLLVAPGKHGADALVAGRDGLRVSVAGTRIERSGLQMLEIAPGSIARIDQTRFRPGAASPVDVSGVTVTLRGEIVDSKCFLGVMVPGNGVTHERCASLCVRGGIPPALWVRDRQSRSALLLLESTGGDPLAANAVDFVGRPIEVTGLRGQRGGWLTLRTDPATWRLLGPRPSR